MKKKKNQHSKPNPNRTWASALTSLIMVALSLMLNACMKEIPSVDASSNEPDDLSISHASLNDNSELFSYNYNCSSDTNNLSIGGPLTNGMADILITDPNGNTVYEKKVNTITGVNDILIAPAGKWQVDVQFINASGTFALSLNPDN